MKKDKSVKKIKETKNNDTFLITLDQNGKEISRKPKEENKRVKKFGFTKGKGGHYYKTVQVNQTVVVANDISTKSRKSEVVKDDDKSTVERIIYSCMPVKPPVYQDHLIILEYPVFHMVSGSGLKSLPFNSIFARVILDTATKSIMIWDLDISKTEPDVVVRKCLI